MGGISTCTYTVAEAGMMIASSVRMLWRQCLIAGTMPLVSRPAKRSTKHMQLLHSGAYIRNLQRHQ